MLDEAIRRLPPPFRNDRFHLLRRGIYDSAETAVYVNDEEDFAFLHPRPQYDYDLYKSRVVTLKLATYKKTLPVVRRRFAKIESCFEGAARVLEVGAADGAFLAHVGERCPDVSLASLEVDRNTRPGRDAVAGLVQHASFEEARRESGGYDLVCMFHVLEHIFEPGEFLADCRSCLAPGGRLVIEVPALSDPLLSLYDCDAYRGFYFQRQHPYVYTAASMTRLLTELGLEVEQAIHHQRYGLENHLQWLVAGEPGGNESYRELFRSAEAGYMRSLEEAGRADSFIAVARPRDARTPRASSA